MDSTIQANARALERARVLDRGMDIVVEAQSTVSALREAEQLDQRGDVLLQRSLRDISIWRAHALSDDARHLASVVMDRLGEVIALEHLESERAYEEAPRRQAAIIRQGHQLLAEAEATREVRGQRQETRGQGGKPAPQNTTTTPDLSPLASDLSGEPQ